MKLRKNGFTLLEILIAIVLFTTGVAAMVWAFTSGLIGSVDAENTAIAMNLAERRIEGIRNMAFASIADDAKADVNLDIDNDGNDDFSGFQWEVEVDDPPGSPTTDDLKQVTVTVYWTYKGGEVRESLITFISKN